MFQVFSRALRIAPTAALNRIRRGAEMCYVAASDGHYRSSVSRINDRCLGAAAGAMDGWKSKVNRLRRATRQGQYIALNFLTHRNPRP